ncbi:hypothetical protein, partial [Escherichia coli]
FLSVHITSIFECKKPTASMLWALFFGVLMSEGTKKKTRSFYAAGLLFTSTGNRVPFRPLPWQPIDGEVAFPVAVSLLLTL